MRGCSVKEVLSRVLNGVHPLHRRNRIIEGLSKLESLRLRANQKTQGVIDIAEVLLAYTSIRISTDDRFKQGVSINAGYSSSYVLTYRKRPTLTVNLVSMLYVKILVPENQFGQRCPQSVAATVHCCGGNSPAYSNS